MLNLPDFKEKKIIFVFPQHGDIISFSNDNIIVKDIDNKIKCQYTCYKIFMLIIVGGFTITTGILERAKKFNFSIVFMTNSFKVYETINNGMAGNTILREKQYNNNKDEKIAQKIIINKISNQKDALNKIRNKSDSLKECIKLLDSYILKLNQDQYNHYEMMGIEGIAAKIYFKQIFINIDKWSGRQPRVKRDSINLLLDIGYTLLFNFIESIVNIYGFDIYKGVLHKEFFKRKSLICDLVEPFRTIIDYKTRKMYSLNQVSEDDFMIFNGKYSLSWKENSKYLKLYIEEIFKYKADIFNFIQSYYRWFMKDLNIDKFPIIKLEENHDIN